MDQDNLHQEPISYEKPKKKRRWPTLLLLIAVVLCFSTVLHIFNFPAVSVERTENSITVTFGKAARTESDLPPQPSAHSFRGTGQTVTVQPSLPGAAYITAEGGMSLQDIYEATLPSVVAVTAQTPGGAALGTGVIMSPDGYIITNQRIVESAVSVRVRLADDTFYDAAVVGGDAASDLAVLKIDASALTPARFGSGDSLRVGDRVVAIGSPIGTDLHGTMTDGIISGIRRDLTVGGRETSLLQTTAALHGGPLINCYGEVVGVCTAKERGTYRHSVAEGLGFAIPMSSAKPIIDALIENGYVSGRPAIGIVVEDLPLRARIYFGLPEGAHVSMVDSTSDAYQKGLRAGDIITAFGGEAVTGPASLRTQKDRYRAGDVVTVTIFRDGAYQDLEITLMDEVTDQ